MSDQDSIEVPGGDDPDRVAHLLRTDRVREHRDAPGGGGHPDKFGVVLHCRIAAIVKPVHSDETRRQAANEEAAWLIAHALAWEDLVGVTVQRAIQNSGGAEVQASVQRLWEGPKEWVPDRALFDEGDAWRVAVFDYLICNQDRSGNNWIATVGASGQRQLRLVDHGHAFGYPGNQLNSEWSTAKAGLSAPDEILERVQQFRNDAETRDQLVRLLGQELVEGVFNRAQHLCEEGSIPG